MFLMNVFKKMWPGLLVLPLLSLACLTSTGAPTALPAGRPANFIVQTITPTSNPATLAARATPVEAEPVVVAPLGSAPTHTPDPNASPTPLPLPTSTPTLAVSPTLALAAEATRQVVTATKVAPAPPPTKAAELDPPRAGGDWDFEADYVPWGNPFGEPCPGAMVAGGWTAFVEDGPYGSSCLNENLYRPNVQGGLKSQEITFDFIAANSGVLRTIPVQPGHRYTISAYAKHDHSLSPVQMFLGVDLTGNTDWTAETVNWFPWDSDGEDSWNLTEKTVTASGESLTIFIRGFHPLAEQGGKTVIDSVSITDEGPE